MLPRSSAAATVLVAIVLRLAHVWQMRDTPFFSALMGDSRGYDAWAQQLAAGDWIGRDVFYQAPLYPYFVGAVYAIFGHDLLVLRIVQALLGAASCGAVAYAAATLVSPRAGLIAGLMLATYPPAIFFDALLQKSVLDVFLVGVSLAIVARLIGGEGSKHARSSRTRWWAALGAAMGALALTRENALLLIAVAAIWAARWNATDVTGSRGAKGEKSTKITKAAKITSQVEGRNHDPQRSFVPFVLAVALVLFPVAVRNYTVGGGFYLTTSQFGSNLYIGNSPRADGSYVALREGRGSPEYERLDATELAEAARGRRLSPSEVSSYWTGETLAYVASRPGDWLRLMARKVWLLLSSTEIIDTESQESHAEYSLPLALLGRVWHFGILLPLAVIGAVALWPERRRLWPVYALTIAYAGSVVVFFVVARYRLPLVPLLIVFGAAGTLAIANAVRRARPGLAVRTVPVAAWAVAAVAILVSNWPLHSAASQRAITENNLGTALQEGGRTEEAIERYRRAITLRPGYAPAMNNLGTALRAAGRVDEAVAAYDRALTAGADRASVLVNRGNALMAQGNLAEAVASFRQAVALDPRSTHAVGALANALYDQGTAALEAGAFERAAAALREAIRVKPDYAEAHNNLGIALASAGNLPEAIGEWEAALRLNPALADARRNLARARKGR